MIFDFFKKAIRYTTEPMPLKIFSDYNQYWETRGFHEPSLNRAKIISKYIEPRAKILDVGCGDGTMLEYLKNNNNPELLMGVDISKFAVEHVQKKGFNAKIMDVLSDDFAVFLRDNKFDYIIITEVLEHVVDAESVLIKCGNSFERKMFISVPNTGFFVHRARLLFGRFPIVVIQQHVKEHVRFWTVKDFVYWINFHGLFVTKFESCGIMEWKILNIVDKWMPSWFAMQVMYQIEKKDK